MMKPKRLQPAAQWLKEQFAFEYCAECSGDMYRGDDGLIYFS
jgi:hypothetical protein